MYFQFKAIALALLLPAVHGMGLCVAAELDKVDVPLSGQNGYQFYRIPAIVTAPDARCSPSVKAGSRAVPTMATSTCCCDAAVTVAKHGCQLRCQLLEDNRHLNDLYALMCPGPVLLATPGFTGRPEPKPHRRTEGLGTTQGGWDFVEFQVRNVTWPRGAIH